MSSDAPSSPSGPTDFIREMIRADVAAGKHGGKVVTRFPPEPNGWPHIGHAKSICLNFGVAKEMGGRCHLRMDDTNPTTESMDYVHALERDVRWLGFEWGEHEYFASDYFERFYELGEKLIRLGRAYVCDLPDEEFSQKYRGTITEAGKDSPYRKRSVEENLDLFRRMRAGEFKDGERVLRARIDMASPNMKMRDPPLVRIKHAHHYRTGDKWCIYPLYDYAHCLEDSFEGVTHSLCTMEFESARELYDWVIKATEVPHVPRQTEFARLNLTYTVMSKRKLLQLVEQKRVAGWDDPRMPTIAGIRRRGYTPEAIRDFCGKIGVAKNLSTVDMALLESCVREDLDPKSPRVLAVLRPLKVVVESFAEGEVEQLPAPYWVEGVEPAAGARTGTRKLPFSRELYIDRDDFMEEPPKGYYRLAPGREVRLFYAYVVKCTGVVKNDRGEVIEVRVTHDPATKGGVPTPGKRVEGTIQWVSAAHAVDAEVRLYDRLCSVESPGEGGRDWLEDLNPKSLEVVVAKVEPSLSAPGAGERYQFARIGYFYVDPDTTPGKPVFNRTVALKDSWARATAKAEPGLRAAKKGDEDRPPKAPKEPKAHKAPAAPVEISPEAKALVDAHGVSAHEARVVTQAPVLGKLLDAMIARHRDMVSDAATLLANVPADQRDEPHALFAEEGLAGLIALIRDGSISTNQAKEVFAEMWTTGKDARAIVQDKGMKQIASADALGPVVDAVLAENADAVLRYKAGNANVMGALVGIVMKKTKGQANPKLVSELVKQKLGQVSVS